MKIICDALIVGGGPSGLLTGAAISKRGFKTIILEEHSKIGKPEQCTGLVSWRIGEVPRRLVLNTVDTAKFRFRENWFEVNSRRRMLIIDRAGYDKHLAEKALEAGVEIRTGERAICTNGGDIVTSSGNQYSGRILVGADGPNSIIARLKCLQQPSDVLFGVQCIAKGTFEQDVVELIFEPELSRDAFAWIAPLSRNRARIGLLTKDNPLPRIRLFLRRLDVEAEEKSLTGDSIRFGIMKKTVADGVMLVGDAACQVKPFSLGGLVYNRICSNIAEETCISALETGSSNEKFLLEKYDLEWRMRIGKALSKGLRMRKLFNLMRRTPISFNLIRFLRLGSISGRVLDVDFLDDDFEKVF